MATAAPSKYALKSLHEEIALFDRKIAHLEKYETFPSEQDRIAAQAKMSVKRGQLVKAARAMTDAGIEFEPSAKTEPAIVEQKAEPAVAQQEVSEGPAPAFQGSVLDFRQDFLEYKQRRKSVS